MNVHLTAIGCRLNEAELENWSRQFREQGHQLVAGPEQADLVVFNSCAVTQQAVRSSRQYVRRMKRSNPQAKMVISGCYATLDEKEAAAQLEVDLVVSNQHKDRLAEITAHALDIAAPEGYDGIEADVPVMPLFERGRQRAFVKIQDGCRHHCTYCIVTVARGEERSRTVQDIVDEVNQLVDSGVQEAVLTGVHVGGYGSDLGAKIT
ncbi:MAG TPA: tRNA (N(6)-L-threonylcarbamoyladenosine(37)-C(2))-methylthiotransferase MtaB, partial [Gammaproteobacteria bacterium]|nr:tRNA (N(6)-L-threonylcarbamoyladenosine(37)-C(2))-methylthiotransferase MtaB [Gammaproteobacteria bacterium]